MMVQSGTKTKHPLKTCLFKSSDERITNRPNKVMVVPAANVDETNTEYILTIASPGFKRENFQVMIEKNIITISATKETAEESCIHDRCEYDYSRWKRDFLLPDDADPLLAVARYKNGELAIRIPKGKTEHLAGPTHIYVY
jgi:HSP20 family protein